MTTNPSRLLSVFMVLLLAVSACGVPRDESPQALSPEEIPPELRPGQLPTAAPAPTARAGTVVDDRQVFMVAPGGQRLIGVQREVVETPGELLDSLFLGTFQEEALESITSAITRETQAQGIEINELFRLATVDLVPGSLDARNSEQRLAFAQIVYTLTSLDDIESVQFVQTDPEQLDRGAVPISVQTDTGTTLPGQRVDRSDFELLNPNTGPTIDIEFEPDIPTPVPTPDPSRQEVIWKLDESNQLVQVTRDLDRSQEALIVGLFSGASAEERERNVRSAIPPDALANSVETEMVEIRSTGADGVEIVEPVNIAFIDLAAASLPRADDGDERLLAAAQIVFTLTELIEIDQVTFLIEGFPIPMPTENGLSNPYNPEEPRGLARQDYDTLLAPDLAARLGLSSTPDPTPAPTVAPELALTPAPEPTPTPGS